AVLRERGLLGVDPSARQVVEAMHRLVRKSPSALVGVALTDAVGEPRAQNQPGTDPGYPNWKIPPGHPAGRPGLPGDPVRPPPPQPGGAAPARRRAAQHEAYRLA